MQQQNESPRKQSDRLLLEQIKILIGMLIVGTVAGAMWCLAKEDLGTSLRIFFGGSLLTVCLGFVYMVIAWMLSKAAG